MVELTPQKNGVFAVHGIAVVAGHIHTQTADVQAHFGKVHLYRSYALSLGILARYMRFST